MRRTKIVATIGPASSDAATLRSMMDAGLDVVRIGLAHGSLEHHIETYRGVRRTAADVGREIGVLVDLPGPKIRCAPFPDGGTDLVDGSLIRVTAGGPASSAEVIAIDVPEVVHAIVEGDRMALGDGGLVMICETKQDDHLMARVVHGGTVKGRPGFSVASGRLNLDSPTKEDLRLVDAFVEEGVDLIAVSFVRSAYDLRAVGVERPPSGPLLVAKIETRAAVENLEGIIETAGAVMVARGDLGIDYPLSELPHLQKHIIRRCISRGRPVITATQMLESMIYAPLPTRAEASDVANAVFDGSSAVMLSGESAIGADPVNAVATMAEITARADEEFDHQRWATMMRDIQDDDAIDDPTVRGTDSLTLAAWEVAERAGAVAIISISRTGFTSRKVTRYRPRVPILAFSPDERVVRQLTLSWGTSPLQSPERSSSVEAVRDAVLLAKTEHGLSAGDQVVVISGQSTEVHQTDTLQLIRIP
ncbi:MAG: pyruvate kinase [Acidimicrobiales bacterium]